MSLIFMQQQKSVWALRRWPFEVSIFDWKVHHKMHIESFWRNPFGWMAQHNEGTKMIRRPDGHFYRSFHRRALMSAVRWLASRIFVLTMKLILNVEVVDATWQFNLCELAFTQSQRRAGGRTGASNPPPTTKLQRKFRINLIKLCRKVFGRNITFRSRARA